MKTFPLVEENESAETRNIVIIMIRDRVKNNPNFLGYFLKLSVPNIAYTLFSL